MRFIKYLPSFLILFILSINICISQDHFTIDYPNYVTLINLASNSAVPIRTPISSGTGSLVMIPYTDTSQNGWVCVITAKHVLGKSFDNFDNPINYFDSVVVYFKTKTGIIDSRFYRPIMIDSALDIAALAPIEKYRSFSEYETNVPNYDEIADLSELQRGLSAIMCGYPFTLGENEISPVIQSGMLAHIDMKKMQVLIDIPVNHGNSGCPVFIITTDGTLKLLGLEYAYQDNPNEFVVDIYQRKLKPVNSSLGIVVLIKPFMNKLKSYIRHLAK